MIAIEIKRYGDFDMPYTDSVWVNESLNSFNTKTLPEMDNEREPDRLIKALKQHGFKILKMKSVTVGGNF